MLPEVGDGMQNLACGEPWPAVVKTEPAALEDDHATSYITDSKSLLSQQLMMTSPSLVSSPPEAETQTPPQKVKQTRNRQKNRWKLKFHHQALPPEYLDHYEASLSKGNPPRETPNKKSHDKPRQILSEKVPIKTEPVFDVNSFSNESFKMWAQRLAVLQNNVAKSLPLNCQLSPTTPSPNPQPIKQEKKKRPHASNSNQITAPSRIMTYNDLPYMGEMTLNNSKPRRGRKPKKADICHLIYENYGTIVPGQPSKLNEERQNQNSSNKFSKTDLIDHHVTPSTQKTDLQNRLISSLMERKLSQENKRKKETSFKKSKVVDLTDNDESQQYKGLNSFDEPLNLCLRDLTELKIEIKKKFGDIYQSVPQIKIENNQSEYPSASPSPNNAISVIQRNLNHIPTPASTPDMINPSFINASPSISEEMPNLSPNTEMDARLPGGYMYWPNTGIYLHPIALQTQLLYYQRMTENNKNMNIQVDQSSDRSVPSTPTSTTSEGASTDVGTPPLDESKSKLVLKQISDLLAPNTLSKQTLHKNTSIKQSQDNTKLKRLAQSELPGQNPLKRKRSAIFIPPMPARTNSTNPTAEVSICKFKFTGGVKPSLQEKKMLSVDAGGNFRYYSGTGNKASRGYEYFPRDAASNQNAADYQANGPENFNNAVQNPFNNQGMGPTKRLSPAVSSRNAGTSVLATALAAKPIELESSKKKRKSRKSLQREKLEQTFKEKGFLIQTQQLESAEGATYCKFRQLRKFTRYLFRSWKDYLPGNLQGQNAIAPGTASSTDPASEMVVQNDATPLPSVQPESSCNDDWT